MKSYLMFLAVLSVATSCTAIKCYECTGISPGSNINRKLLEDIYEEIVASGKLPDLPPTLELTYCGEDGHTYNNKTPAATCPDDTACSSLNLGISFSGDSDSSYSGTLMVKQCQRKDAQPCGTGPVSSKKINIGLTVSCWTCPGDYCNYGNSAMSIAANVVIVAVAMVTKYLL